MVARRVKVAPYKIKQVTWEEGGKARFEVVHAADESPVHHLSKRAALEIVADLTYRANNPY